MVRRLTYLMSGVFFAITCGSALAAPSVESGPTNTLERTVEYGENAIPLNPTSRGDLRVELFLGEYRVGDPFKYGVKIQSTRKPWITIDNQNQEGLEWKLQKDGREVYREKFEVKFSVIFKRNGTLSFNHDDNSSKDKGNSVIEIKAANAILKYKGFNFHIPPILPLSFSIANTIPPYRFTEPGIYTSQLSAIYDFEGKRYKTTFESEEFEVTEK